MPRRPRDWEPDQDVAIGRLAWLAAFPELRRRSSPWWAVPFRIFVAADPVSEGQGVISTNPLRTMRGSRAESEGPEQATSDRLASYAEPVDKVAARLSTDEQTALRDNGALPDWFFDAVEKERKAERRSRR